jgi:hypothetical protein
MKAATPAEKILAEARAYGVTLVPDGARLRIGAPKGALTAALRAKIIAHKSELLTLLGGGDSAKASPYEQAVRAWSADYTIHMARALGYSEESLRAALDLLTRQPPGRRFRIGREVICIEMGEGIEVRVHRTPQAWTPAAESGSEARTARL